MNDERHDPQNAVFKKTTERTSHGPSALPRIRLVKAQTILVVPLAHADVEAFFHGGKLYSRKELLDQGWTFPEEHQGEDHTLPKQHQMNLTQDLDHPDQDRPPQKGWPPAYPPAYPPPPVLPPRRSKTDGTNKQSFRTAPRHLFEDGLDLILPPRRVRSRLMSLEQSYLIGIMLNRASRSTSYSMVVYKDGDTQTLKAKAFHRAIRLAWTRGWVNILMRGSVPSQVRLTKRGSEFLEAYNQAGATSEEKYRAMRSWLKG